ncbi:hypothetical protein, conserved [Babesia ovata]|uniref:Uncharacterized protein n=1 Tax=Babesia ovata TaxID=189622 RepID=A0A2H6K6V0_9APIC|nr:uncharacterized protein BOVATA_002160 [Babesia ovata]GBE58723.1 hypothetical protein, conserved [Babesia ovata]
MRQQPKKLTDCPENLRESIDWLIQVRHGNGEHGLKNLAEALKKLIGDAIKNASESLNDRQKELLCADKSSAGLYDNHCQKLQKGIDDAKKSEAEISKLKKKKADHYNEVHYLTEDARKRALGDIEERQKSLENLKQSLEAFIGKENDVNPAAKLLENLCDGLQTFLGFNPDSKGYDGTGIVYSDLDRLCDGVMAFLGGVLESVKEDENVKYYYPVDDIDAKLQIVKKSMYKGPKEFSQTIEAVTEALQVWDGELQKKINNVNNAFNGLKLIAFDDFGNSLSALKNLTSGQIDKVPSRLDNCIRKAGNLAQAYRQVEKHYNILDPQIKKKLKDVVHRVQLEVEKLVISAKNDELKAVVEFSGKRFVELQGYINNHANHCVNVMKDNINREFEGQIKSKIIEINDELKGHIWALEAWISSAQDVVDNAIRKCEEILNKLDGKTVNSQNNQERKEIEEAADALWRKARALLTVTEESKKTLTDLVKRALTQVKHVDEALKADLYNVKTQLTTKLGDITSKITTLGGIINGKKNQEIKTIQQLVEHIESMVKSIEGSGGGARSTTRGLWEVVRKVNDYVSKYAKGFDATLGEWVASILEHDEPVKRWLKQYVNQCYLCFDPSRINGGHGEERIQQLTPIIVSKIRTLVTTEINASGEIVQDLEKISSYLAEVAEATLPDKVNSIVAAIEAYIVDVQQKDEYDRLPPQHKKYLTRALEIMIPTISSTAKQAGKEVRKIADNCKLDNVNDALKEAGKLDTNLKTALAQNGGGTGTNTNHAALVDQAIKAVGEKLNDQLPEDGQKLKSHVKLEKETWFPNYHGQVNQDKVSAAEPLTGGSNAAEGALPKAIGAIREQVEANLKIINGTINKDKLGDAHKAITSALTTFTEAVKKLVDGGLFVGNDDEKGVTKILADLKTLINNRSLIDRGNDLTAAKGRIHHLQNSTLTKLVHEVDNFYTTVIETQVNEAIGKIQAYISQEIIAATKDIQEKAKNDYFERIHPMFEEMKTKVSNQIKEIQNAIDYDLSSGVKGLMRWMYNGNDKYKLEKIKQNSKKFTSLSNTFRGYSDVIFAYVQNQVKNQDKISEFTKVGDIKNAFGRLLRYIANNNDIYNFDHMSVQMLADLSSSIHSLSPTNFHGFHNPLLLDALRSGMDKFTEQLSHAYVNRYSGKTFTQLVIPRDPKSTTTSQVLSTEGRNCAKVCLTILERMSYDLRLLVRDYSASKSAQIYAGTEFGKYFSRRGYYVASGRDKQDGQLQRSSNMTGGGILKKLDDEIAVVKTDEHLKTCKPNNKADKFNVMDIIRCLVVHLRQYYNVCHYIIPATPRAPSNIYQMLLWLTGLQWNPMLPKLGEHVKTLFDKPYGKEDKREYKDIQPEELSFSATTPFTAKQLHDTLDILGYRSEKMLIIILGHGHPDGRYAVDFNTNVDNLLYPGSPAACLDMLADILNRVFYQLRFLCSQCSNIRSRGGWQDCHYGRYVGGSSWRCNEKLCPNQDCPQRADQSNNQNTKQRCDQHPKCGVKSPLQSYLEDGLPGFLPHQFKTPGCKLTCTVPNHFGKPCLTPMGFGDIAITASHTKDGLYLWQALHRFCVQGSHLLKLCSQLNCLLRRTPQTLGDIFGFYYNFLENFEKRIHKQYAFDKAVKKAIFGEQYNKLAITSIQQSSTHGNHTSTDVDGQNSAGSKHLTGDIFSLVKCKGDSGDPVHPCGPYLESISNDICDIFSEKRADNYLSWIVYITETFYDLLKKLYDECSSKCGGEKPKCRVSKCIEACNAKKHPMSELGKHHTSCSSIVKCPDTLPNLYKYGFTFRSPATLSGVNGIEKKRTCYDFCNTLKIVVKEQSLLHKLGQIHLDTGSTLVALAPLPAAHHPRPPRRLEDTLPLKITLKPPHRRTVAPRRRTRQGTRQDKIPAAVIYMPLTIYVTPSSPSHLTDNLANNVVDVSCLCCTSHVVIIIV